jgi:hypothetical protein
LVSIRKNLGEGRTLAKMRARAAKSKKFLVVILPPHYSNRGEVKAVLLPLIEWQALHKLDNKRIRK